MKPGSRIKSNACDTEVVIIKYTAGTIQCGGADMSEAGGGGADHHPRSHDQSVRSA